MILQNNWTETDLYKGILVLYVLRKDLFKHIKMANRGYIEGGLKTNNN